MPITRVINDTEMPAVATAMIKHSSGKNASEVESVSCECCGLTEECTASYIVRVREVYRGRWICGLCAEAVKDEIRAWRSKTDAVMSTDEALNRHIEFCEQFRSSRPPMRPTEDLISAMKNLLRRSLDSPRQNRSPPSFVASKARSN